MLKGFYMKTLNILNCTYQSLKELTKGFNSQHSAKPKSKKPYLSIVK